jgi:hypothetical protein
MPALHISAGCVAMQSPTDDEVVAAIYALTATPESPHYTQNMARLAAHRDVLRAAMGWPQLTLEASEFVHGRRHSTESMADLEERLIALGMAPSRVVS